MTCRLGCKRSKSTSLAEAAFTVVGFWLLMVAGTAAPVAANCPNTVSVAVDVNLDLPAMTRLWLTGTERRIESELRIRIADKLQQTFRYWCFRGTPAEHGPRLQFRLLVEKNEAWVQVVFLHGPTTLKELKTPLWKPHELGYRVVLSPKQALEELPTHFEKGFSSESQDQLRRLLMDHVPVAMGGQWRRMPGGDPSVVLPLPWDSPYQELELSDFELRCRRTGRSRLDLPATGSSEPGCYPVDKDCKGDSFQALQVFPTEANAREDLTEYVPEYAFLRDLVLPPQPSALKLASPPGASP